MNLTPEAYTVRRTTHEDVDTVMEIINLAKEDMKAAGSDQWQKGSPNAEMIHHDVDAKKSYVLTDADGSIQGTAFISAETEPTYLHIHNGSWRFDAPYTVIHRIAVRRSERGRGLASYLIRYAIAYSKEAGVNHLRIDTHPMNIPMQHFLARSGFSYRGEIDTPEGLRIAYDYQID